MTDRDAQNKICPIAKLRGSFDGNWDKGGCIGSGCMWWRWVETPHKDDPVQSYREGYCGMAGIPQ